MFEVISYHFISISLKISFYFKLTVGRLSHLLKISNNLSQQKQ